MLKWLVRGLGIVIAILVVAAIGLYLWIPHPTGDRAVLAAIRAESQTLMATHRVGPRGWTRIPESEWPPVIASLHPFDVAVFEWGVDIGTEPFMDGGWGYGVPRSEADRKMLTERCYDEAGEGVLWHVPC